MVWQGLCAQRQGEGGMGPKSGSKKRSNRADAVPTRSHAHLHPQTNPFGESETKGSPAALRLRGLPFSVTIQDVLAFFAQHDVADRIADGPGAAQLLPKGNGRPSGQAVVQMRSRADAEFARSRLSGQCIGNRYMEVFVYGGEDCEGEQGTQGDVNSGGNEAAIPPGGGAGLWPLQQPQDMASNWGAAAAFMPWGAGLPPPPVPSAGAAGAGLPGGPGAAGVTEDNMAALFGFLWQGQEA